MLDQLYSIGPAMLPVHHHSISTLYLALHSEFSTFYLNAIHCHGTDSES